MPGVLARKQDAAGRRTNWGARIMMGEPHAMLRFSFLD
jgi:hypothetical protein